MNSVFDIVTAHLPPKRKTTPSGWTSFNAPCCIHNGDSADTRQRGGLYLTAKAEYVIIVSTVVTKQVGKRVET